MKERYCILEKIGSGGNGSVYLAQDMVLGCRWAVKVIEHGQKKEAVLLKELHHPFLPKMIDYEEKDDHCFLVMEYIEGQNLESYLRCRNKLEYEEMIKIILSIASIMAYFHKHSPMIIYGDMKPANLIMAKNGEVYLVDFGSVVYGYKENPAVCYGTNGYAAPEQYAGRVTMASDVYAFGKTVLKIMQHTGMRNKKIQLYKILWKCCARNERYRYKNMMEVQSCLKKIKPTEKLLGKMIRAFILLIAILFGLFVGSMEMSRIQKKNIRDFNNEWNAVTEIYWNDIRLKKNGEVSAASCKKVENQLKDMQNYFGKKEEQRKILGFLAMNAEYMGEFRNAAFYYEQMLIYDSEYMDGYGLYGLFLLRLGQEEESRELFENCMKNHQRNDSAGFRFESLYFFEKWKTEMEGIVNES